MMARILIIDDDELSRATLSRMLMVADYAHSDAIRPLIPI